MSEGLNGARELAKGIVNEPGVAGMPGFADMGRVNNGEFDYSKYIVRYLKVDADDPAGLGSLEALETKGLKGTDIVILNKASWTFMDRYLMLVTYLELNPNA